VTPGGSLSVCMMAHKPAPQVRSLLELLRPLADELVLAVDARGDPEIADRCHDLTDQLHRLEPAPFNRWSGWLHNHCEGDWILRFDDDEVPSRSLLDGLRGLLERHDLSHVAFTRRWLHPDLGSYITSHPWLPDYQIRLVRNVPGLWRFPGVMHAPIEVLGEHRLEDMPIYHADLVLASLDERRRKRELYESRRAHVTSDGFPVNFMYTPEDRPGVETAPTPSADRELIDAVQAGSAAGGSGPAPDRPALTLDAEDRYSETRIVGDAAYSAGLRFVAPPRSLATGTLTYHELIVENRGAERWPWAGGGEPLIRLGYRWLEHEGGEDGDSEGPRTAFTEAVAPGDTTRVMLAVEAPRSPGRRTLEVDVVHEHVRWFGSPLRLDLSVETR
jgi:hypothetical protein